ncbi:MAG TPA: PhoH family protein, partial [Rhodospirillales bacterium]|nr:PhoH family protein [Rhodospirillales bacterium]
MATHTLSLTLMPDSTQRLSNLCGRLNEHIHQIEAFLGLRIQQRGNIFQLSGTETVVVAASPAQSHLLSPHLLHLALQELKHGEEMSTQQGDSGGSIKTPKTLIKPRSRHQQEYVVSIHHHDINFGVGPAGTGKTYLAVACAVAALIRNQVDRILLVRPAVEAG